LATFASQITGNEEELAGWLRYSLIRFRSWGTILMLHRVEDKRRLEKAIQDHIKSTPELRPFPQAVTRLISTCRDSESTNKEIESVIASDPSLSVKVLRLANSPLFCPSRDVNSIVHAVSLLGRRKVKSIALSAAAADMLAAGDGAIEQRRALWDHSLGCAAVASCLAKHIDAVQPDDAFLAGIFHDVGKLLFLDVIPAEYEVLTTSYRGSERIEEEQFFFGTTHEEIGASAANLWGLPVEILAAVGWHHRVGENPFDHPHASIIAMANECSKFWGIGSKAVPEIVIDTTFFDQYELSDETVVEVEQAARIAFDETSNSAMA
jgi:HD-like signal output (HDOD) protein